MDLRQVSDDFFKIGNIAILQRKTGNNVYDFEEETNEYKEACAAADSWRILMDELQDRVVEQAKSEGLLTEQQEDSGVVKQLEAFMAKYGYRDGCGWWVKLKK